MSESEEITFPITAPGADKVAEQFGKLAKSADAAATKAELLAAESAAATKNLLALKVTSADAVMAVDKLAKAADAAKVKAANLATAANDAGAKLTAMSGAAARAAVVTELNFNKLSKAGAVATRTVGVLGLALGESFGSAVGRAGGAISGISSIIAGPWGLAIGAAVAAVGLLTQRMDANAEAAKRNAESLLDLQEQEQEFARGVQAAYARDPRTGLNGGQREALRLLEEQEALGSATGAIGQNIDAKARPRSDAEFQATKRHSALQQQLKSLRQQEDDSSARMDRLGPGASFGSSPSDKRSASGPLAYDAAAENKARDTQMDNLDRLGKAQQEYTDRAVAGHKAVRDAGIEAMGGIGSTGITALSKLSQGYKITMNQIRGMIGDILVVQGAKWLFEGIGMGIMSFGLNPQSEALIALGTAEIAAGMAIGAKSAPSAGRGGGGGGSRPFVPAAEGQRGEAGGTTVINLNYATVTSPTAQDGQRAYAGIQRAQAQGLIPASR